MSKRSYGQYCALARTLDIVGERWTLLVIRELIGGPKRYSDVLAALPGIGTSLLARRLQSLEADGIVARRQLPPPAASTVYELTDTGDELAEALLPLTRWGARHALGARHEGEVFRTEWPLLLARAILDHGPLSGVSAVYEFRIDESVAHLGVHDGRVDVRSGPAEHADVVMTTDVETFVDIGLARTTPNEAVADGRLHLDGTPEALDRFAQLMSNVTGTA